MPVGRGRGVRAPRKTEGPAPGLSNGIGRGLYFDTLLVLTYLTFM